MTIAANMPGAPPVSRVRDFSVLIIISIIATAFNDLAPILPVGELSKDAFIYFLPALFFVFLRDPGGIASPVGVTIFVILFL